MSDQQDLGFRMSTPPRTARSSASASKFENEAARREHFTELLREKLKDPAFRRTEGFQSGTDEDILRLSDPPYLHGVPQPVPGRLRLRTTARPTEPATLPARSVRDRRERRQDRRAL